MKTFHFDFGFGEIWGRFGWPRENSALAIRKYEIARRDLALQVERALLHQLKARVRNRTD